MKCFAALVCLLFLVGGCVTSSDQPTRSAMLHWLDQGDDALLIEEGDEKMPFTGNAIEVLEQSPTKSVSNWRNGRRDGWTYEYYYSGRKQREVHYRNGVRDGASREFLRSGEKTIEETYANGKLHGPKTTWHINGNKATLTNFKNGEAYGEAREWYEGGQPKSIAKVRNTTVSILKRINSTGFEPFGTRVGRSVRPRASSIIRKMARPRDGIRMGSFLSISIGKTTRNTVSVSSTRQMEPS